MQIRFKYKCNSEYYLTIDSKLTIKGEGYWTFEEYDLIEMLSSELLTTLEDVEEWLQNYFWTEIGIGPDCVEFNKKDIEELYKLTKENEYI